MAKMHYRQGSARACRRRPVVVKDQADDWRTIHSVYCWRVSARSRCVYLYHLPHHCSALFKSDVNAARLGVSTSENSTGMLPIEARSPATLIAAPKPLFDWQNIPNAMPVTNVTVAENDMFDALPFVVPLPAVNARVPQQTRLAAISAATPDKYFDRPVQQPVASYPSCHQSTPTSAFGPPLRSRYGGVGAQPQAVQQGRSESISNYYTNCHLLQVDI